MNFIIANGVVVVPVYGTPTRTTALEALQAVFPDRKVIGVSVARLARLRRRRRRLVPLHHPAGARLMAKRTLTVAAIQTSYGHDLAANIAKTEGFVREAAKRGAQVILPSELFQGTISARSRTEVVRDGASVSEHPCVLALQKLAEELGVVIPISFFEKDGPHYYNSVVMADADGEILGVYRKSHIPDGPGYQEKYYFRPGDTGFKAWKTQAGTIGVGICWDQWYPEARPRHGAAGRRGAVLSDRHRLRAARPTLDTHAQWQRAMQGHAVSNAVPVVAANRIGSKTTTARSRNSTATRSSPTIAASSSRASAPRTKACS